MEEIDHKEFYGAIDQSTTATKFTVFDLSGKIVGNSIHPHTQITPQPGWLEHDPIEILNNMHKAIEEVTHKLKTMHGFFKIRGVGITNQRETVVAWNKNTGKPYYNAIVWSDTRTLEICKRITEAHGGNKNAFRNIAGLPINTYFSAFKIKWLLENVPEIKNDLNDVLFGTMDSWVTWNLTKNFVTDQTNASRTFLMNLKTLQWENSILEEFGIPVACLPEIKFSCDNFGTINEGPLKDVAIKAVLGDQQAAALGHAALNPGDVKHTYGTGCFLMMNTGPVPSFKENSGLLTTVLFGLGENEIFYGLEGAIECGGSTINWMRDRMGYFKDFDEMDKLIHSVEDNGDVYSVPCFSGLFSPMWREDAAGSIIGLTMKTEKAHVVRAMLEGICYRTKDVIVAMEKESGTLINELKVDGGITNNSFIMQFQSNALQKRIVKSEIPDTTSLGVTFAAMKKDNIWKSGEDLTKMIHVDKVFHPKTEDAEKFKSYYRKWEDAISRTLNWKE